MKTKIFLILLVLGAIANAFGQMEGSGWKTVLSADKSKILVISINEKHKDIVMSKKLIRIDITEYDTISEFKVSQDVSKYINDSVAFTLTALGLASLLDSLLPNWTNMFGQNAYLIRELRIEGDQVVLKSKIEYRPAKMRWFITPIALLLFSIIMLGVLFSSPSKYTRQTIRWGASGLSIFFILMSLSIRLPVFDSIFLGLSLFVFLFPISFFFAKRGRKMELKKGGYDLDNPMFVFEDGSMAFLKPNTGYVLFVDRKFRKIEDQPYDAIDTDKIGHHRCQVMKDGKSGFIDAYGKVVIPIKFGFVSWFTEGLCRFKDDNKWGFINELGETVIEAQFDEIIEPFKNGKASVRKGEEGFDINTKGEIIAIT